MSNRHGQRVPGIPIQEGRVHQQAQAISTSPRVLTPQQVAALQLLLFGQQAQVSGVPRLRGHEALAPALIPVPAASLGHSEYLPGVLQGPFHGRHAGGVLRYGLPELLLAHLYRLHVAAWSVDDGLALACVQADGNPR